MRYFYLLLIFLTANEIFGQATCAIDCNKRNVATNTIANYYQNNTMNKYDLRYLKLEIGVEAGSRFISGTCLYKAVAKQLLDTFAIEFKQGMTLDSILVNNVKRNFSRQDDHIYIPFSTPLAVGSLIDVLFFYSGTPTNGIIAGSDANLGLTYSGNVSESFQAREWFPAKQLLNDKIDSADLWITTTTPNIVGSNGLLKFVVDKPNNKKQYQWHTNYPMSYYMPFFGVGNYMDYRNYAKPAALPGDSILIQHLLVNNTAYFNNQKAALDETPAFVEKMSELFGLYPFYKEKYGHAQVRIGGGMEHQTMSTMHDFSEELVPHELGHQWFGDNVTCASWNDIWLNESFAAYCQYLMREKLPALFNNSAFSHMGEVHTNVLAQPGGSIYVPLSASYNEGRIFDPRLSYNKGSGVLNNLRFEMQSDTLFFNTLKTYQQRFKDSFATTTDFKQVAEQVSGKNLTTFFNQWIYGEGYPTYNISYGKSGADSLLIMIDQTTSMPSVTPFFSGLLELKINSTQGDTIIKVNHTSNNQQFKIRYTKTPSGVEVDPNNFIINKVGSIVTAVNTVTAQQANIKIYPNPASTFIKAEVRPADFQFVQIADVQGRIVFRQSVPNGSSLIQVPLQLPGGLYFLHLIGKKANIIEKILIR